MLSVHVVCISCYDRYCVAQHSKGDDDDVSNVSDGEQAFNETTNCVLCCVCSGGVCAIRAECVCRSVLPGVRSGGE